MNSKNLMMKKNKEAEKSFDQTTKKIKDIVKKTEKFTLTKSHKNFFHFFYDAGVFILRMIDFERKISDDYFSTTSTLELKNENEAFYSEILPENYDTCWANPSYSVQMLGEKFGQLFSYFYLQVRQYITMSYLHTRYEMAQWNEVFIKVFEILDIIGPDYDKFHKIITKIPSEFSVENRTLELLKSFDPSFDQYKKIIQEADLNDERYLFSFPGYVTEDTIRISKHIQSLPEDKVDEIAEFIANAYERGFTLSDKDMRKKSTVMVMYHAGFERIIRQLCKNLRNKGLVPLISNISAATTNKQYSYDHRFDTALYLDEEFVKRVQENLRKAFENCKIYTDNYSGVIYFSTFGEEPFSPKSKKESLRLSKKQQPLMQQLTNIHNQTRFQYTPRDQTSFTIISFPTPEIGDEFEQIFDDIYKVNILKNEVYEPIQQKMIDVLDTADFAHIKGKGDNSTDLKVKLQSINDPSTQTNFVNCTADVNIPLGEIFTSPQLKGTKGVLHIKDTYLGGLRYKDLTLVFEDGFIKEYSCSNFKNEEDNKKYIQENLIFPHKTLPIGEFAIGTNTFAYIVARKFDILRLLPVLIIEKMGPHFAVGDTCFTFEEDKPAYNPDGKEITARENEKTKKRKEDISQAYTFCHQDITLPYEAIGHITAVMKDGTEIDILRDERFVLKGTEMLNEPLDNYYNT